MITVHSVIKNEPFIYYSIKSVYPYVDKILLYDTGSDDAHTLKDCELLLSEDTDHKITFKQIPVDIDKKMVNMRHLKDVMNREEGEVTVGSVRKKQIEDTDTEFFMIVDGDEVHYPETMRKIPEILGYFGEKRLCCYLPLIWFSDMGHVFDVYSPSGRIFKTEKVLVNDDRLDEMHTLRHNPQRAICKINSFSFAVNVLPYAHFETFLKPWKRRVRRPVRFDPRNLPEVMIENDYFIKRFQGEA